MTREISALLRGAYTIITASGGITGTFKSTALTGAWRVVYGPTSVRLVYLTGTLIKIL